jgi:signal transduction histidine kinase
VALGNLLSNAIKYSRDVPSPEIEIGHRMEGQQHLLWVKDNGVGFDGNHSDQVFGAFKRMHRTDQFEGTGVGLAIVQRIVTKHGGRAYAESEPGKGTIITISLPVNPSVEQALPFAS